MPLDTTALDPSATPASDAVWQLAMYLFREAGSETVRTREALAVIVANRAKALLRAGDDGGSESASVTRRQREIAILACLADLGMPEGIEPHLDDLLFASCHRIAKRAINGALHDPTGGARRFHLLGHNPGWARGLTPCAWIGSYLFYFDEVAADFDALAEDAGPGVGSGAGGGPDVYDCLGYDSRL